MVWPALEPGQRSREIKSVFFVLLFGRPQTLSCLFFFLRPPRPRLKTPPSSPPPMSRAAERQRVLLQHLRPGAPAGVQVRGDGRGARAASGTNGDRAPRRSLLLGRLPASHSRQAAGVCVAAWGPATRGPAWRAARGDPQKMLRWRWASETAHRGGGAASRPAPPPARVCWGGVRACAGRGQGGRERESGRRRPPPTHRGGPSLIPFRPCSLRPPPPPSATPPPTSAARPPWTTSSSCRRCARPSPR